MNVLAYFVAVLGAAANATSSVLQRKANREVPASDNLTPRLILDLLREPVWFGGVFAVIVGFVLQAVALASGALATIQPIFVIELPFTLIIASRVFHGRLHKREWLAVGGMTFGLGVMLYLLSPSDNEPGLLPAYTWVISIAATVAFAVLLVALGRRASSETSRSALLGIAAGTGFGLTAALIKAMTGTASHGAAALFTGWPLYAVLAAGIGAFFLLQSALNAGPLVAAQPGLTLTNPVVSVAWGVGVYGESVRTGFWLVGSCAAALVAAGSVFVLTRSPMLHHMTQNTTDQPD